MIKPFITIVFLLAFGVVSAQNKSFVYQLKYKPNPAKDSAVQEKYILDIKDGKSLFRTVREKKSDSTFYSGRQFSFLSTSLKDYNSVAKDLKARETKKYISNFQKVFSIKVDNDLEWNIEGETKEILGMKAQRATTIYGSRKWIAYFTTAIPLHEGPYVVAGLPGLIIEIYDTQNDFHFSLIQIKTSDGELYEKGNVLPITWSQYEKLALDYYADPTRDLNGKNSGSGIMITKWTDEKGNEITPNFKEMNLREQKALKENNNPIELDHKEAYK